MAKIVQTEGRTSSLLECYAEVQPIFCKDTKKIETTIPVNSIFLFSTQRLFIREPPNYLPTEATEPTEVSDARYSPTDFADMHRLGGYGILPYPRSHKTIFPQNPTQPNHLCASVRICGRLFSARSFCVFCEIRGRTLRSLTICVHLCASVGGSSTPEASVYICEIRGRLFYARSFCVFCEFRGRTLRSLTICEICEICGRLFSARSFCVFCFLC